MYYYNFFNSNRINERQFQDSLFSVYFLYGTVIIFLEGNLNYVNPIFDDV